LLNESILSELSNCLRDFEVLLSFETEMAHAEHQESDLLKDGRVVGDDSLYLGKVRLLGWHQGHMKSVFEQSSAVRQDQDWNTVRDLLLRILEVVDDRLLLD